MNGPPTTWPCSARAWPSISFPSRTRSARSSSSTPRCPSASSASSANACRPGRARGKVPEEFNMDMYIPLQDQRGPDRRQGHDPHGRGSLRRGSGTAPDHADRRRDGPRPRLRPGRARTCSRAPIPKNDWEVTIPLDRLEEAERATRSLHDAAGLDRRHLAARRRHRHHEHHAGHRHRTDPRDRRPPGPGGQAPRHHRAVPHRGRRADHHGRPHRPAPGTDRRLWRAHARSEVPAKLNVLWTFLAILASVLVGVVFGWYPAWRASRLDPIEALRHV